MRPVGRYTVERGGKRWSILPADIPSQYSDHQYIAFEKGFTARTFEDLDETAHNPYTKPGMRSAWVDGYDYAKRQA